MARIRRHPGATPGWLSRWRDDGRKEWEESAMSQAANASRRTALLATSAVVAAGVAVEVTAVRAATAERADTYGLVFRVGGTVEDIAPGDYAPNTAVVIRPAP